MTAAAERDHPHYSIKLSVIGSINGRDWARTRGKPDSDGEGTKIFQEAQFSLA
jgi:hypothetical protein